jgi:hypothetical protein
MAKPMGKAATLAMREYTLVNGRIAVDLAQ